MVAYTIGYRVQHIGQTTIHMCIWVKVTNSPLPAISLDYVGKPDFPERTLTDMEKLSVGTFLLRGDSDNHHDYVMHHFK